MKDAKHSMAYLSPFCSTVPARSQTDEAKLMSRSGATMICWRPVASASAVIYLFGSLHRQTGRSTATFEESPLSSRLAQGAGLEPLSKEFGPYMAFTSFLDARHEEAGSVIETDLCIIGSGAAGITIAREFIGSSIRVCLLEA